MFRNIKVLLIALAVLVLAGGAYGFAAGNTWGTAGAPANVGYKGEEVSGFTISHVVVNKGTGENISSIEFDLSPASGSVPAAYATIQTTAGDAWTACKITTGEAPTSHALCADATLTFTNYVKLNILASSNANTSSVSQISPLPTAAP